MSRHDSREIENVKVMLLKGDSGSTIVSIEKTGTSGLVDTYTITMSDGSKSTFTVSNGKEIISVEKTGTSGLVDTYTMTFNDDSTETFEVVNGNGIASIEKTGTQGAVDTYTITLDDGSTYTFTVTNATGTVDSELSTSSPNPVENRVITYKINAMDANIAGTEDGATASQTYIAGDFILRNNQFYEVTTAIAIGDALTVGVNISDTSVGEELSQLKRDLDAKIGHIRTERSDVNVYNELIQISGKVAHLYGNISFPQLSTSGYWLLINDSIAIPDGNRTIVGQEKATGIPKAFTVGTNGYIMNAEAISAGTYYFDSTWIL